MVANTDDSTESWKTLRRNLPKSKMAKENRQEKENRCEEVYYTKEAYRYASKWNY